MRVVIDGSNLRAGGGLTHLRELLAAGDPRDEGITAVTLWAGRASLDKVRPAPWLDLRHDPALDGHLAARTRWQSTTLATRAKEGDLLFAPGGSTATHFRPRVTMCRNMLPFESLERGRYGLSLTHARLLALRWVQARSFAQADGVIFLTEYARQAVRPLLGPSAPLDAVIAHGVSPRFTRAPRPSRPLSALRAEAPLRVVAISQLAPYKHPLTVVEAVRALRAEGLPVRLDLYGAPEGADLAEQVRARLRRYDPTGEAMQWHGPAPFESIDRCYAEAEVFVFASSCENMPNTLVEAMASGLPMAVSRRGPMPEVLGGAGLYFDPEDPAELAAQLRTLVRDASLRDTLAEAACTRATRYTWARCAAETWQFLRAVGQRPKRDA